jgi:hypothetical protein
MATAAKQPQLSIFNALKENPKYHQARSLDWFRQKIKDLGATAPTDKTGLLKTTKDLQSSRLMPGTMVFFGYDPKHKETLPYYDRFPLSFIFSMDKLGMTGINFHYLPLPVRIKLFDKMWQIAKNSKLPTQQVMALNWNLLSNVSKFPEVAPAVKRYLYNHVQTRFIKVPLEDWKTAIMLPNEMFAKQSARTVASYSLKTIASQFSNT